MRYIAAGVAQLAGVVWLVAYALGPDSYYAPSDVSRWEHASKDRAAAVAVVAGGIAATVATAFVAQGIFPSRKILGRTAPLAVVTYLVALAVAWFSLTLGH